MDYKREAQTLYPHAHIEQHNDVFIVWDRAEVIDKTLPESEWVYHAPLLGAGSTEEKAWECVVLGEEDMRS